MEGWALKDQTTTSARIARAEREEAAMAAAIGRRIALLRKARELSLDALVRRAGVSKGTLVQIEQGRANPGISTLCRLAAALGASVADLVAPADAGEAAVRIVGPGGARRLWSGPNGGSATLLAGTRGPDMLEIWAWRLMPGERFEAGRHGRGTRELLFVTEGVLHLEIQDRSTPVAAGSTAIALTDRPHAYANGGAAPVRFFMTVHEPAVAL